ncbi:hypothetical protein BLNAU_19819 [Blattamonas nauphoetae]|uniref:Uncharacterized protein n=1 Tax=Blattamonas nauphoetae TaxID=2049346 RepID=A0ABQ9X0Y3_9EUKA|nr:hypothetical protein BLNAU_19819 [Blattamonas nauphoetae]
MFDRIIRLAGTDFHKHKWENAHILLLQLCSLPHPSCHTSYPLSFFSSELSLESIPLHPNLDPLLPRLLNGRPLPILNVSHYNTKTVSTTEDSTAMFQLPVADQTGERMQNLQPFSLNECHTIDFAKHFHHPTIKPLFCDIYQREAPVIPALLSHISSLPVFWLLLIIGHPICVLAPTSRFASMIVSALVSLISPLSYGTSVAPFYNLVAGDNLHRNDTPTHPTIFGTTSALFFQMRQIRGTYCYVMTGDWELKNKLDTETQLEMPSQAHTTPHPHSLTNQHPSKFCMLPDSPYFEERDFSDYSPSSSTLPPDNPDNHTTTHTRQLSQPVSETSTAFDETVVEAEEDETEEEHDDTFMSFLSTVTQIPSHLPSQLHLDLFPLSSLLALSFPAFSTPWIDPPTTPSPNKTRHSDSSRFKSTRLSFSFRYTPSALKGRNKFKKNSFAPAESLRIDTKTWIERQKEWRACTSLSAEECLEAFITGSEDDYSAMLGRLKGMMESGNTLGAMNEAVKDYFEGLTRDFMSPLEEYFFGVKGQDTRGEKMRGGGESGKGERAEGIRGTFRRWRDERKKNESPKATSLSVGQSVSTDPSLPPSPQAFLTFSQKHPPTFCARVKSLDAVLFAYSLFFNTPAFAEWKRQMEVQREWEEKMLTEQCIERGWCGGSDSEALREERAFVLELVKKRRKEEEELTLPNFPAGLDNPAQIQQSLNSLQMTIQAAMNPSVLLNPLFPLTQSLLPLTRVTSPSACRVWNATNSLHSHLVAEEELLTSLQLADGK